MATAEIDDLQAEELQKKQRKHAERRAELEKKIKETPIARIENVDVPMSSHIVINNVEWYQKFAMIAVSSLIPVSAAAVIMTIALAFVMNKEPETLSYLMDSDGRVVQLRPIKEPSLTEPEVLAWAADKIQALHNLSFTDYRQHVESLRPDFSPQAYIEYMQSLKTSKGIAKIEADRLNMYVKPVNAPRILDSGVVNGVYTWIIEMRVRQFFAGGEYQSTGTDLISTVRIERASRTRNLSGVVISKYLSAEAVELERKKREREKAKKAKEAREAAEKAARERNQ